MGNLREILPAPTSEDSATLIRLLYAHVHTLGEVRDVRDDERASKAFDALLRIVHAEERYPGGLELERALRTLEQLADDARWREESECAREHGYAAPQRPEPRVKLARIGAEPAKPTARRRKR